MLSECEIMEYLINSKIFISIKINRSEVVMLLSGHYALQYLIKI